MAVFYRARAAAVGGRVLAVRLEWLALLGAAPDRRSISLWQVATLKPDDGADALAKFRSNRFAGLLMFLACLRRSARA